jgi:hypothetical protein
MLTITLIRLEVGVARRLTANKIEELSNEKNQ